MFFQAEDFAAFQKMTSIVGRTLFLSQEILEMNGRDTKSNLLQIRGKKFSSEEIKIKWVFENSTIRKKFSRFLELSSRHVRFLKILGLALLKSSC